MRRWPAPRHRSRRVPPLPDRLRAVHALWPEHFRWRERAYELVDRIPAIDLLTGSPAVRDGIDRGASLEELAATWKAAEDAFAAERAPYLLYPA